MDNVWPTYDQVTTLLDSTVVLHKLNLYGMGKYEYSYFDFGKQIELVESIVLCPVQLAMEALLMRHHVPCELRRIIVRHLYWTPANKSVFKRIACNQRFEGVTSTMCVGIHFVCKNVDWDEEEIQRVIQVMVRHSKENFGDRPTCIFVHRQFQKALAPDTVFDHVTFVNGISTK